MGPLLPASDLRPEPALHSRPPQQLQAQGFASAFTGLRAQKYQKAWSSRQTLGQLAHESGLLHAGCEPGLEAGEIRGWGVAGRVDSGGAICSPQHNTVTSATTCPPLCQPPVPRSPTASHKVEGDTGHPDYVPRGRPQNVGRWTGFSVTERRGFRWRVNMNKVMRVGTGKQLLGCSGSWLATDRHARRCGKARPCGGGS